MSGTPDTELGEEGRLARVKATASVILNEYLMCESSVDAAHLIEDLSAPRYHAALIKRLLTAAMDKSEAEQDMAGTLVSSLCVRGVVQDRDCEAGLEELLKSLRDGPGSLGRADSSGTGASWPSAAVLTRAPSHDVDVTCHLHMGAAIDVPKAVDYAARFLSHFLDDKIVPESILDALEHLAGPEMGAEIKAQVSSVVQLPLPMTTIKARVRAVLDEYFVSGSLDDAIRDLAELEGKRPGQEAVKRTLLLALEKKNREKEMASLLLSAMTRVYGSEQFFEGFIRVLKDIDDVALDNPDVVKYMSNFIARAVVDDVLPPAFFDFVPPRLLEANERVRSVEAYTQALLDKHTSTRLMNIWGAGAKSSVEELKASVKALVDEYFIGAPDDSCMDEALDCVRELDAPYFGHEVVKRIVYEAVERGDTHLRSGMLLLKGLLETTILDAHQLTVGMQRCVEGLADLSIDVPDAPERLRTIADWLAFEHLISPAFEQAVILKAKERAAAKAEVTEERVHSYATFIVEEFLVCQSGRDAAESMVELKAPAHMHPLVVHKMLLVGLDKSEAERRLVAEMLSSLVVRDAVEATAVEAGVEELIKQLPDLVIDIPKVEDYVSAYLAHLIEEGHVQASILDQMSQLASPAMAASIKTKVSANLNLPLPVTTMKNKVRTILEDYFASGDLHSTVADLAELEGKRPGQEAVKRAVVLAMDMKNSQRERASLLLSAMTRVYGSEQFFEGFIRVLKAIDDLALDTPDAASVLALFLARAIMEDVLPPSFISLLPPRLLASSQRARQVVASVETLMDTAGSARILNAWGAGAKSTVDELKGSVKMLVDEYLVEGELEEAVRCVLELDAPHFGHEVVKRIVYQAVERGSDALAQGVALLKALRARSALADSQLNKGMVRAVVGLGDLSLDVPAASSSLAVLLDLMLEDKLIMQEFKIKLLGMSGAVGAAS